MSIYTANVNNMGTHTVALNMSCPCIEMSAWSWLLVTEICSNFTLLNILLCWLNDILVSRARAEPDGTRAETTFRLSPKRTSPFKSAGESVQSTAGSRGVGTSVSNVGYTTFRGRVRVLATHSIRQFPLHFPSRASPCATTFRTQYTTTQWHGSYKKRLWYWVYYKCSCLLLK